MPFTAGIRLFPSWLPAPGATVIPCRLIRPNSSGDQASSAHHPKLRLRRCFLLVNSASRIRALARDGVIVVCSGGGGLPVVHDDAGGCAGSKPSSTRTCRRPRWPGNSARTRCSSSPTSKPSKTTTAPRPPATPPPANCGPGRSRPAPWAPRWTPHAGSPTSPASWPRSAGSTAAGDPRLAGRCRTGGGSRTRPGRGYAVGCRAAAGWQAGARLLLRGSLQRDPAGLGRGRHLARGGLCPAA
jgi:hypothetical protein